MRQGLIVTCYVCDIEGQNLLMVMDIIRISRQQNCLRYGV